MGNVRSLIDADAAGTGILKLANLGNLRQGKKYAIIGNLAVFAIAKSSDRRL